MEEDSGRMGDVDLRLSRRVRRVCEGVVVVLEDCGWSVFGLLDVLEESLVEEALLFLGLLLSLEGEEDRNRWMVVLSNLERGIHSSNLLS